MRFEFSENPLSQISSDAALVFSFQNTKDQTFVPLGSFQDMDKALAGQLSTAAKLSKFTGKRGEILSVIPNKKIVPTRIFVIGLGAKDTFVADDLRRAMGVFAGRMNHLIDSASLVIPGDLEKVTDLTVLSHVIAEGLLLGVYEFNKYREKSKETKEFASVIISAKKESEKKEIRDAIKTAELYSQATILARDLVNEPANVATPTFLANLAVDIAKSNPKHIKCRIIDKDEAKKMGMGAFLSIAQAADTPPKFIHLEYTTQKGKSKKKLALIGKGITFDSGGISLKPPDSMMTMKCDMSGAAIVLGVFSVISDIQPDFPVMGLIAATPNLISGTSTVPGDVARAYNGKTIEILNTDAEGRVTMADSLSYAVKEGATELIDFATLTGACIVALGNDITGLFSNNRDLAEKVKAAAFDAGEKMWELPLEKEYKELNKSDVADISNIPNSRYAAGAIAAGLFLEEFVDNKPWVHLDIAGPAFLTRPSDLGPKGATGHGVRTVLNLLREN